MNEDFRARKVRFADEKLFAAYEELKGGRSEEKELAVSLDEAIQKLKLNSKCGIKIPSRLWPREYVIKYQIDNLWKLNLRSGWRLIYTITTTNVEIVSILLEWFKHKDYEKKFKYNVK
ncbi:TPA: hypothetical protein HA244_05805 [Candidatus Micrarchaeota archaeon]|nr:hypothetical protein [Candidatus Micrarchaeota archaeon]